MHFYSIGMNKVVNVCGMNTVHVKHTRNISLKIDCIWETDSQTLYKQCRPRSEVSY